jgi:hypothetical protein
MGTNYYSRRNRCDCCGRYDERHIGKSSAGWVFTAHVYPEESLNSIRDLLIEADEIYDEYNRKYSKKDILDLIYEKRNSKNRHKDRFCIKHEKDYDCCIGDFS